MERRYLSITSLLATTKHIHQDLVFETQLLLPNTEQKASVQLAVRNGVILSCEIRATKEGPLLFQSEEALKMLLSQGLLEWYRAPPPPKHTKETQEPHLLSRQNSSSTRPAAEQIPVRRKVNVNPSLLDHTHRRVLLLVDGTRSIRQIASLLSKTPEELLEIFLDLQKDNYIIL